MASRRKGPLYAWRIADNRHPLFDGAGAALTGGRWNSPGNPAIYASTSYACAMLEKLAQTGTGRIPRNQAWIRIHIPKGVDVEEITPAEVSGWDLPDYASGRNYGDLWFKEQRTAVLIVPSVVTREDHNIIINPHHPETGKITTTAPEPVIWDERLFRK